MKASEALIAWTPATWTATERYTAKPGTIEIRQMGKPGTNHWARIYRMTAGAVYPHVRALKKDAAALQLFLDWQAIVVRDGIDPKLAHEEFLKIDEYAEYIARDIDGAKEKTT